MTIEQLEALEKAATAGPWRHGDGGMVYGPDTSLVCNCFGWTSNHSTDAGNARFVVAARDSIGNLLAVAKAAKECKELLQDMIPPKECTCKNDEECGDCYFFGGKRQVLEMVTKALSRLEAQ